MILSDGEIRQAIKEKRIIIDPAPTEEQYTTSALDLMLGEEIFEFKTEQELRQEEPTGVERPIVIDTSNISIPFACAKVRKASGART